MSNNGNLLKAKEVAQLLGVSEHWVRVRTMRGEFPDVKLSHLVRYEREKIEEYVARRRRGKEEGGQTQA